MSEQREIRGCPCCPDGKGRIYRHGIKRSELFYVGCLKCGLRTADYTTSAEAIAAWNQRAEPSPDARLTAALGECALLTEACKELDAELAAVRELQKAVDYEILPMKTIASTLCAIYPDAGRLLEWLGELESLTSCDKEMK